MKKIVSIVMAISLLTSFGTLGFAAADPDKSGLLRYYDFDSLTGPFSTGTVASYVQSGDIHDGVLSVKPVIGQKWLFAEWNNIAAKEPMTVSFDFLLKQTDHLYDFRLRDTGGVTYAMVMFDEYENIQFGLKGVSTQGTHKVYTDTKSFKTIKYNANEWYTMDIIPNFSDKTVKYYINGKYICTAQMPENKNLTAQIDNFYFGCSSFANPYSETETTDADGSEQVLIDNLRIGSASDSSDFYADAAYNSQSKYISVDMSQSPNPDIDLDSISVLNTDTGEQISTSEKERYGKKIVLYTDDEIKNGVEYVVIMPDSVKSITGKVLYSKYIYFRESTQNEEPKIGKYIKQFDFSDSNPFQGELTDTGDAEYGKAVKVPSKSGNIQFLSGAGQVEQEQVKKRIMFSYDVFINENIHDMDWRLFGENGVMYGLTFFDKGGNFVFLNGSGEYWSDDDKDNFKDYSSKHTAYALGTEPQSWHNVTVLIDYTTRTTKYYIDGNYAGEGKWSSDKDTSKLTEIRVTGKSASGDNFIYFDNYKIGYPASDDKINKFRIYNRNGEEFGPAACEINSNATDLSVWFDGEVQGTGLSDDNVTLSENGTEIPCEFIGYDSNENRADYRIKEFLNKNTKYDFEAKGVLNNDGQEIRQYHTFFTTSQTGKLYIEKNKIVNSAKNEITNANEINKSDELMPNIVFSNTSDEDITVKVGIVLENDGQLQKDGIKFKTYIVPANSDLVVDDKDISVNVTETDKLSVKSIILDSENNPLCDPISFSKEFDINKTDWTIELSGQIADVNKQNVCLSLYKPDSSALTEDSLVFRDVVKTNDSGEYYSYINMFDDPNVDDDALSGIYLLEVKYPGGTEKKEVVFTNKNEQKLRLKGLNDIWETKKDDAVSDIAKLLKDNVIAFGITNQFDIDYVAAAKILVNYMNKNGKFDADTDSGIDNAGKIINKAVVVEAVSDGLAKDIFSYDSELNINIGDIKDWYQKGVVSETLKNELYNRLKGKEYSDIKAFDDSLTEQFILSVIKCSGYNGYADTKDIIQDFKDKIGVTATSEDTPYRKVAGNSYSNYKALAEDFEKAKDSNGGTGGSTGGSGGGGKSSSLTNAEMPIINTENTELPSDIFNDINGVDWAKDAIIYLAESGIVNGKTNVEFAPNDNITRAEAIKLMVQSFAKDADEAEISFDDVKADDWYYHFIAVAKNTGLANGYSNEHFGSEDNITRQDLAVMMYNALKYSNYEFENEETNSGFSDESDISDYATEAVNTLKKEGVISGYEDNTFRPTNLCSRAEAAVMLYNVLSVIGI